MTTRVALSVVAPETPRIETAGRLRCAEPCTMVIFGAGDLVHRKLMPALHHLMTDRLLPDDFAVVAVARREQDSASFRGEVGDAVRGFRADGEGFDRAGWDRLAPRLHYLSGAVDDPLTYGRIEERLTEIEMGRARGHLFYLAVPPSQYAATIDGLAHSGVAPRLTDPAARPWVRIVIEKPFGRDLGSAVALNACLRRAFAEHQVYRIDHYLGKETVQNLLFFRFANSIFEPVWNRRHVHHVEITAAETVGVEHRAKYYEEAGVVRDMFQNHLLQLLTLTAMEPPVGFTADAVRDEKVKVLKAIRPFDPSSVREHAVRGQYGPGTRGGERVPGYRREPGVPPASATATYAAIRFMIDNWRWQGVPFYVRSGKRMPSRTTEIAIQFREPPRLAVPLAEGQAPEPNSLTIGIQPREGIALRFVVKMPGLEARLASVDMDFCYSEAFGELGRSPYETLLLDCIEGDATLFTRGDEAEAAWRVVDPILDCWEGDRPEELPCYAAGTWGPPAAHALAAREGFRWREP